MLLYQRPTARIVARPVRTSIASPAHLGTSQPRPDRAGAAQRTLIGRSRANQKPAGRSTLSAGSSLMRTCLNNGVTRNQLGFVRAR